MQSHELPDILLDFKRGMDHGPNGRLAFAVEGAAGNVLGLAQNLRRLGIESPVPKKRYDRGHERLPLTAQAHPATPVGNAT
jgi:hypothetical protein